MDTKPAAPVAKPAPVAPANKPSNPAVAAKPVKPVVKPKVPSAPVAKPAPVAPASKPATEDLSKYTIGAGGTAPAQAKKGTVVGFGLAPKTAKKEEIPLEVKNKRLYFIGVALSVVVLIVTSTLLYLRIKLGS